ncbi:MAG: ROK family transcriptional regulator [Firmicutes bacterium]|nr:ROK family transcriptional regulator [Bacillota bacterium]
MLKSLLRSEGVVKLEHLRRGNKALIKDLNRALVLHHLRIHGPLSRTDIATETKLGLSTITKITDELITQGLIREVGEGDSSGGRRPVFLEFIPHYGHVVGAKIEKGQLVLALTDLEAEIVAKDSIAFPVGAPAGEVLALLADAIATLVQKNKALIHRWLGIGIGISGLVDQSAGELVFSSLLGWGRVPFREILSQRFSVPVFIDNDVNTYALAELSYGYGREADDFLLVTIGAGIGAGLILDKKIYRGGFGGAGEIGHMVIATPGNPCYCGRQGCLEAHAGEQFILSECKRILSQEKDSLLYNERLQLTMEKVLKAAKAGDYAARQAFYNAGRNLGIGLVNLINILNPTTIILAGEGMVAEEFILPGIKGVLPTNFFNRFHPEYDLRVSRLGEGAWEKGAATLVINELFKAPIYQGQKTVLSGIGN